MSFLIPFLNILAIGCLALWFSKKVIQEKRALFWTALSLKLIAGIALGLVYFYYYGVGDTIGFFSDSVRLVGLLQDEPELFFRAVVSGTPPIELTYFDPRSFFFTVLLTFANLASGNNYWISSLWFSMFSFICAWYLVARVSAHIPALYKPLVVAFLFFPSVVFWSSGIIKESIAFGSLCFLTGLFVVLIDRKRLSLLEYLGAAVALWLLLGLKYYWAAVFLPSFITSLIVHWLISPRGIEGWRLAISWVVIFAFCCVAASFTHPNFYLETFLEVIRLNHAAFVAISDPGNVIDFPREVNAWSDVVVNSPLALFSGLFRPLPFEGTSITGYCASAENLALLILTIARFATIGKPTNVTQLFWLSTVAYVCLLCIFLTLSTPNFGTLSRYRIGFLPFLVVAVLHDNILVQKIRTRLARFKIS